MARQLPIGVLISGNGTNLQAIIDAIEAHALDAKIEVVLSNKADAYGLARAKKHNLYTAVLDHTSFSSREAYDEAVLDILRRCGVELVVLAGFMRLLSPLFIKAYSNRIMKFLVDTTEPLLGPLRRMIPPLGRMDISPIVAFLILWLFQAAIAGTLLRGTTPAAFWS